MTLTGEELSVAFVLYTIAIAFLSIPIAIAYYITKTVKSHVGVADEFELYRHHVELMRRKGVVFKINVVYRDLDGNTIKRARYDSKQEGDPFDLIMTMAHDVGARNIVIELHPTIAMQKVNVGIQLEKYLD